MADALVFAPWQAAIADLDGETVGVMLLDVDDFDLDLAPSMENVDDLVSFEVSGGDYARQTNALNVDIEDGHHVIRWDGGIPTFDIDGIDTVNAVVLYHPTTGTDATRTLVAAFKVTEAAGYDGWTANEPTTGLIRVRQVDDQLVADAAALVDDELGLGTAAFVDVIDEDDMATDSATRPPSQQSVAAFVAAALEAALAGVTVEQSSLIVDVDASTHVDLTAEYSNGRTVNARIGGGPTTRASVDLGDPTEHRGQRIDFTPQEAGSFGASIGWNYGPTPAVLGDIATAIGVAFSKDLDFASTPESFELTVNGTPYTANLDTDHTGDGTAAILDCITQWTIAGAPITSGATYTDVAGERLLLGHIATTATGASATMAITDSGAGDRLGWDQVTITPGTDDAWAAVVGFWAIGDLNGNGNNHTWPDNPNTPKYMSVASDGVNWVVTARSPRPEETSFTVANDSHWQDPDPTNLGQAANRLAAGYSGSHSAVPA